MPLDGITTRWLAQELHLKLKDARVDKIYQPDRYDLLFVLRTQKENLRLILSANPASPRIHLTSEIRENPQEPPMFCMLLRKHLLGARLLSVETPGYERIVTLTFQTTNELGDTLIKRLIIEAMGRHSNIILTNQEGRIHDAILHVDESVSRLREIMPARTYGLPQNQAKTTPEQILEQIRQGQFDKTTQHWEKALDKSLLDSIQGFSPQLCQDIVEQSGLDPRSRYPQLSPADQQQFKAILRDRLEQIISGQPEPSTYYRQIGDRVPFDFHAFRLKALANPQAEASISQAMNHFFLERNQQNKISSQKQQLAKRINNELDNTEHRLAVHEQELEEGQKRETYREFGELLVSQLQRVPESAEAVDVDNYFDPELQPVRISLIKALSPQQNVQRYFKLYQKAKGKYEINSKQVILDRQDIEWLQSLLSAVEHCNAEDDIRAIREELAITGLSAAERWQNSSEALESDQQNKDAVNRDLLPGKPGSKQRQKAKQKLQAKGSSKSAAGKNTSKNPPPLPPRQFLSSDGILIQAGRNNIQNDRLTLRTAQKEDIWLHAQKIAGTHVIIRCGRQSVPDRTLEEAAQIAAFYSKAQTGTKVPVDYCPVTHVKKIAGGKPGLVQYEHYQTILVEPKDPEQHLKKSDAPEERH